MASVPSLALLKRPAVAERIRQSRGSVWNLSCSSVPLARDRRLLNGSTVVENLHHHRHHLQQLQRFGLLWSTTSTSSLSPVLPIRCRGRASSIDLSNGPRGDEPVSDEAILSAEEQTMSSLAVPDSPANRFWIGRPIQELSARKEKALQRGIALVSASVIFTFILCLPRAAHSLAENSISASSLGVSVAEYLRGLGWSDEVVVLVVGMLPVLELRGAIPISYWLKVEPVKGYLLAVLGNMLPVPFIVLYLEKILKSVGEKGESRRNLVRWIVDRTLKQAGPIKEFEWLGLLLFVAVPLPGTGAWSGAIAASILGMPFWDAVTANLAGVLLAGLLVSLLVTVGINEAIVVGIALFVASCSVWSVLRFFKRKKKGALSL